MRNLIEKAIKTIFFRKETGDAYESLLTFRKLSMIYGTTEAGRLVIPLINEKVDHPHRITTSKLYEFCETIKQIVSDPNAISGTLNKNTVNKDELSLAYHKIVSGEKGKHALELFLEHFIPLSKKSAADILQQSQFSSFEVKEIIDKIESFCFEFVFIQTPNDTGFFLAEVFPNFKDYNTDDYFGSRIIIPIPVVFKIPGTQNFSKIENKFLLAKSIFFSERLEELAESNTTLSPFEIDKIVIQEWSDKKEPWIINKEKWVFNFFNQIAVNHLMAIGVQNTLVSIGECTPQVFAEGIIFSNN